MQNVTKFYNIKKVRKQCGLTQQEAADCTGHSLSAFQRRENGEIDCSFEDLELIANGFGVPLKLFLNFEIIGKEFAEKELVIEDLDPYPKK